MALAHTPVSLCLIVKNEAKNIKNVLDSVKDYFDEICITDTGSTDDTRRIITNLPYAHKIRLSEFNAITNPEAFFPDGGIYDFASARNFNFAQAKHPWIFWMDADDTFQGLDSLQQLLAFADQNKIEGYFFKYWYMLKDGVPVEKHRKLQVVKNNGHFEWRGRIHEDCLSKGPVRLGENDQIIRMHTYGDAVSETKLHRNLRILIRELQDQGDKPDPRTLFYTARAFISLRRFDDAIELLEKYRELSGWPEELYEAMYLLADCYMEVSKFEQSRDVCLQSIKLKPLYPDAYFSMGRTYSLEGDFNSALMWLDLGFKLRIPTNSVTHFEHRYTAQPMATAAVCFLQLGKLDDALVQINKAMEFMPNSQHLEGIKNTIEFVKRRKDVSKAYVNIASYLKDKKEEWKIPSLLGTVSPDLEANPLINKLKYDWLKPKIWPVKSIAILAFGTVEAWSPNNEKKGGIGGSEEAVINLSRELQKLGHDVTVYTNTGTEDGVYDGVTWKMFTEFNGKDEFDTVVIWRATGLLEYDFTSNVTLFDMHDVPQFGDWDGDRPDKVDQLMVKSAYHRSLLPEVKESKFSIVTNGINPDHFKKPVSRQPHRCIYSSAIDRGLDILLTLWPQIRTRVPDAELHIFYGFQTFKALNKSNPERMRYCDRIEAKMKELEPQGVIYHGRVDHETLAEEMLKSDIWLYPTYFPEISCITAMKAQAAGMIPVCTDFAALNETVQYGRKIAGDIYLPEVQAEFVKTAVEVLKDEKYKEETRIKMQPWALETFAWANVARAWDATIENAKNSESLS